jgi:anti-anti-sigma factor
MPRRTQEKSLVASRSVSIVQFTRVKADEPPKPRAREVRLEGEWDLARKDEIAALFGAVDGESPLTIDMTGVTYIDTSVLEELVKLRNRHKDIAIALTGVSPHVRRVFEIVSFGKLFDIRE